MDIAKIRKKAQAQAQLQSQAHPQTQAQGSEGKPEEVVQNQVDEPGPDLSAMPSAQTSTQASAQASTQPAGNPAEKAETLAGEIPEGEDRDHAEPQLAAAPEAPQTPAPGGSDGFTAGAQEDGGIAELLIFSLAKEEFAFKVSEVEEIIRFQRITLVPTMPEYMAGITSLRGKIIPVIDLRMRLALKEDDGEAVSMPEADADGLIGGKGKIIVLSGPFGLIGAIIDKVLGVVRLPGDVILEPPAHLTEDETKFIEGVVIVEKRFISIIRSADALKIEVG